MGLDVSEDAAVCDLGALGYFIPVDGKTSVSWLDVSYALRKAANTVGHDLDPFHFIGTINEVLVLLGLSRFGEDDCVHHYRLEIKFSGCLVDYCPILSSWMYDGRWLSGCGCWSLDGCHMVGHEIFYLDLTCTYILSVYLWHSGTTICVLVCCRGHWFRIIWGNMGCTLGWPYWCLSWLE